jgi:hypothetical protein
MLLCLTSMAAPARGASIAAPDTTPEVVPFTGKKITFTLHASKHVLGLRSVLPDLELEAGAHALSEASPLQAPGPLLLVGCSGTNRLDGDVRVLGSTPWRVQGPKIFSVFSFEPFIARFPGRRLRMVNDNAVAIFAGQSTEILVVVDDYRYVRAVGLDPTAKYRVSVAGKRSFDQVLVAADLELPANQDSLPANAAWNASRAVLRGGGKADLPATRQVAFTLAGVEEPTRDLRWSNVPPAAERSVEVSIEEVHPGTGELGLPRNVEVGRRSSELIITASKQLLSRLELESARALLEQCLSQEPKNAECHLLFAKTWELFGDRASAIREGCLAARYGDGLAIGDDARQLLGEAIANCR